MSLSDWKLRLRALLTPRQVERELDEELAFHVERETEKLLSQGMSPRDARARALARFGPVALAADNCRDTRGTAFIDNTVRDVHYAFRTFSRTPLAAVTIIGTVALGLGLITMVFTLYNAFFLRIDAVVDPERLVEVHRPTERGATTTIRLTRAHYEILRRDSGTVSRRAPRDQQRRGEARTNVCRVTLMLVTGSFFEVLGARAGAGLGTCRPGRRTRASASLADADGAVSQLRAGRSRPTEMCASFVGASRLTLCLTKGSSGDRCRKDFSWSCRLGAR